MESKRPRLAERDRNVVISFREMGYGRDPLELHSSDGNHLAPAPLDE
jgi:hypothetical protein